MDFEWVEPTSVTEAVQLLEPGDPGIRVIGGGTALSLMMKQKVLWPEKIVALTRLHDELSGIRETDQGGLRIGAATKLRAMERSEAVKDRAPVVAKALRRLSNPRIRNMATIGGNLSYGDPHLDLPAILTALEARVRAVSVQGERWIPITEFFRGYYTTALRFDELLTELEIPPMADGWRGTYLKFTSFTLDDWPTLGLAALVKTQGGVVDDLRLVAGAITEVPTRLTEAENVLRGERPTPTAVAEAGRRAADQVEPLDDIYASAWYKKEILQVYVRQALAELLPDLTD